jgi:acyl phosphate:glycerol-3-phosphate acyltransferase
MTPTDVFILAGAYLCGSVPYGFLAGKLRGVDLRREGSGNIGATNALRVLGKPWGYPVFLLDFLKGFLPVFLLRQVSDVAEPVVIGAGILVIIGHNFPVWLGFRGGKGIATSGGVILGLFPAAVFLSSLVAWVALFFGTRYVSVASIAAALMLSISTWTLVAMEQASLWLAGLATLMSLMALLRHRSNISRLLAGTEPRFTRKPKPASRAEAQPTS